MLVRGVINRSLGSGSVSQKSTKYVSQAEDNGYTAVTRTIRRHLGRAPIGNSSVLLCIRSESTNLYCKTNKKERKNG